VAVKVNRDLLRFESQKVELLLIPMVERNLIGEDIAAILSQIALSFIVHDFLRVLSAAVETVGLALSHDATTSNAPFHLYLLHPFLLFPIFHPAFVISAHSSLHSRNGRIRRFCHRAMAHGPFGASQLQTFISATLGSVVSQSIFRGIHGAPAPIDFTEAFLEGTKVGTSFIAYPVAVEILKRNCPAFKKTAEDPNASKIPVYVKGGALGAAIVTAVHYPVNVILGQYRSKDGKAPGFDLKAAAGFYVDQIGSSIGFAATNGTLAPKIPTSTNSFLAWARANALVNISNIGGKILSWPVHAIRHGATLTGQVGGYLKIIPVIVATGDATNHFKGVLAFLLQ
jgi:hypothetical protein